MDRSGPPVNFFYMDLLRPSIVLNGAADVSGHVFLKKTSACSSPPPPPILTWAAVHKSLASLGDLHSCLAIGSRGSHWWLLITASKPIRKTEGAGPSCGSMCEWTGLGAPIESRLLWGNLTGGRSQEHQCGTRKEENLGCFVQNQNGAGKYDVCIIFKEKRKKN